MLNSVKSLVLNYSFEPLQFCSAKRAIVMVLAGRAEFLESDGYVVRSPSTTFRLPAVIRVLKMVKRSRRKGVAFSKKNILRRDNFTCQYCGVSNNLLTVDHILPKSRGGKTSWNNVVVACKPCNLKKGNQTPSEKGMELVRKPRKPNFHWPLFHIPAGPRSHLEIWQKYLPGSIFAKPSMN
ncbi:HNH endonuclease [Candidatus Nitromaritima sp. SCGC AAA799-A02]|nr:HNH endonuclease [Candidatus Nitromaritima sp. SCGC AAA799-A02]KMP11425.1 HNH endonuclease [Candidatus Nitromaritima sp. SCGC AAA799-C22]